MKKRALTTIRKGRGRSQADVAKAMRITQSAVSKLETRSDVSVAVLRDYVKALGGELVVSARFSDETVPITTRDLTYGERAPSRRVADGTQRAWEAEAPVVAPEWLDEVHRIRSLTPGDRIKELVNAQAFFAAAKRRD